MSKKILFCFLLLTIAAFANTPGKHAVGLTWTETGCAACSFNVYRAVGGNACIGVQNPTPINIAPIVTPNFVDVSAPVGALNYSVTASDPTKGGESACSTEAQITVPAITTPVPSTPTPTLQ